MHKDERSQIEHDRRTDTDRILTLPNILSFFRLVLIPFIIYFYERGNFWAAFGTLFLSGVTDVVDGWIARTFHLVSDFGKAIDPVADKLTQIAVLLCLLPLRYWWVVAALVFKELTIGIMVLVTIGKTHSVYSAGWYGKLCTVIIYLSMAVLMLWEVVSGTPVSTTFLLIDGIVIVLAIALAFYKYFSYYAGVLKEHRKQTGGPS